MTTGGRRSNPIQPNQDQASARGEQPSRAADPRRQVPPVGADEASREAVAAALTSHGEPLVDAEGLDLERCPDLPRDGKLCGMAAGCLIDTTVISELPPFCAGRVRPIDAAIARHLRDVVDLPPTVVHPWQGNRAP